MYKLFLYIFLFISSNVIAADLGVEPSSSDHIDEELVEDESEDNNEPSEDKFIHEKKIATVQILNKITAKIKYLEINRSSQICKTKYCSFLN